MVSFPYYVCSFLFSGIIQIIPFFKGGWRGGAFFGEDTIMVIIFYGKFLSKEERSAMQMHSKKCANGRYM